MCVCVCERERERGRERERETSQHAGPSRITGLNCQSEEASVPVMTYSSLGHAGHDWKTKRQRRGTQRQNVNRLDQTSRVFIVPHPCPMRYLSLKKFKREVLWKTRTVQSWGGFCHQWCHLGSAGGWSRNLSLFHQDVMKWHRFNKITLNGPSVWRHGWRRYWCSASTSGFLYIYVYMVFCEDKERGRSQPVSVVVHE